MYLPNLYIAYTYLPNLSTWAGYDRGSIFKRSLTGLDSEFSISLDWKPNQGWRPSLPYYLPIAGGRIRGFIPFPMVLEFCENAVSLIQDLNSCDCVHFLQRKQLHHRHLFIKACKLVTFLCVNIWEFNFRTFGFTYFLYVVDSLEFFTRSNRIGRIFKHFTH